VAKQINTAQFSLPAFLKSGAVIQTSLDHFKLITGPFIPVQLDEIQMGKMDTILCQPHFWDFLQVKDSSAQGFLGQNVLNLPRAEFLQILSQGKYEMLKPKIAWQNVDALAFKQQFDWSQIQFREKNLQKTVPIISQACSTKFSLSHLHWVLQHFLSEQHFGWAYGFWDEGQGYLGQSPEKIASWQADSKVFKTTALAGTLKNSPEAIDAILRDRKIQEEHRFVVDDIQQKLSSELPRQNVQKSKTEILQLKHVVHLKTDFECQPVARHQVFKLIECLHPTAALGLYPNNKDAMKIFSQFLLQDQRLNFAAPFTVFDQNSLISVAAIRNFHFSEEQINLFSGCGVTEKSIYEDELSELELKRESVKKMMGLTE
jgi:isochorismate synthase EntC